MKTDKPNNTRQVGENKHGSECCDECIHTCGVACRVCLTCPCHKETKQVSGSLRDDLIEIIQDVISPDIISETAPVADEILSLLKQKLEGVVGEEKKLPNHEDDPLSFQENFGYNQKREEILQKIKELFN